MRCDDCLKSALKQMTDKLATIVAMNYSMEAAALNQAMESTIISELPNIMARWVILSFRIMIYSYHSNDTSSTSLATLLTASIILLQNMNLFQAFPFISVVALGASSDVDVL